MPPIETITATTDLAPAAAVGDAELLARFRPLFDDIAAGAVEREAGRRLPIEEIRRLRAAGFGALRVPRELGGSGVSLRQLFLLLTELGAADSNLVQALRVHYRFTEERLAERDTERGREWLRRIGSGVLVGNASSERSGNVRGRTNTTLTPDGDRLVLNGTKYYSTGSLYSDYISVAVTGDDGGRVTALVRNDTPGIELFDDYSGFGQYASASGTTVFTDAAVDPDNVITQQFRIAGQQAVLQLTHLATLAGIARRAVDDIAEFVRRRRRSYGHSTADLPRDEALVQQVIGKADATAHAARDIVLSVAARLDRVVDDRRAYALLPEEDRTAEADNAIRDLEVAAELDVYRAQSIVIELVLRTTTEIFEVGGASALDASLRLDRHWRNARTLSSHNPLIYRQRQIGDHLLNGTVPNNIPSVGEAPGLAADPAGEA
ncbi:acyl-CoA dehydrogenase family protein [Nocardia sp. alder85J]|uniref:acyl-CoA dehydrogenase family protein n=1 Tax=Nocardia sp. alder85J TaxID=2862949 RepID=UPI001CD2DD39|nr:acyl-CoA dehydrogenase family protein [Nocardia sp. alder85J]MCX4098539.1 acyl-CoA dehydrogenase family protein [Nocardia sp. alder85J]